MPRITPISVLNGAGMGIIVYLAIVLGQTVYHNYQLNRQIETLNSQIALLKARQEQLKFSTQYYQTDAFKDREARSKLGLQQPGESVLILPSPRSSSVLGESDTAAPAKHRSNLAQWLDFLAGKG